MRASLPSTSGSGFRGRLTPQPAQRLIPSSPSCSSAGVEETRASPKSTQAKGGGVLAAAGGIRSRKCNIGLGTLQPFGLSNGILEAAKHREGQQPRASQELNALPYSSSGPRSPKPCPHRSQVKQGGSLSIVPWPARSSPLFCCRLKNVNQR